MQRSVDCFDARKHAGIAVIAALSVQDRRRRRNTWPFETSGSESGQRLGGAAEYENLWDYLRFDLCLGRGKF